jgi:uncharacterized protein involved in type VI secretion and phage assembly
MGELMEPDYPQGDLAGELLEWVRSKYFGKYRGQVTDNEDPTARGRVKLRVISVLDDLEVWAMPCVPYAGPGIGFYSIPPVGAGVWVEFEAGDPSYPIWTGCFWADGELPVSSGPSVKIWKTDSITVQLDDDGDEMLMQNSSQSSVTISSDVTTASSQATHTVGSDGVVSEQGAGKLEVTTSSVNINSGAFDVM